MRNIPIDNARVGNMLFLQATPATDFDTKEHKRNSEGIPLFEVQCLLQTVGFNGEQQSELFKVKVPAQQAPNLQPLQPVHFGNFVARAWSNNGKSGVAFSADSVIPAQGKPAADNK